MNHVKAYYAERIHRAYHAIQMEVLHIDHEMQFKVLSTHHGIQVEVLYAHRRWLNGTLTLGNLITYLMLLLLGVLLFAVLLIAVAIRRHTRDRYALAQYNAAWERKRHKWQAQGVIRLILGELAVISGNVEQALAEDRWHWFYPLPHNAWEHHGALIAESLSEDKAAALIEMYVRLSDWEMITAEAHQQHPNEGSLSLNPEHKAILGELQDLVSDASQYLRKLAYPDTHERDRRLAPEREFLQQRINRLERGSITGLRSIGLRS